MSQRKIDIRIYSHPHKKKKKKIKSLANEHKVQAP